MIAERASCALRYALSLAVPLLAAACGPRLAVGGGLSAVRLDVGGKSTRTLEPILSARVGAPDTSTRGVLVVDVKPVPTKNPVWDESVSSVILMPSVLITDGRSGLRLGVGPVASLWTGNTTVGSWGLGLAAGVAFVGNLRHEGRNSMAVEVFATAAAGEEVGAILVGVQLLKYVR